MDWTRSSVPAFVRGPVLHTPEGWAFLAGTVLSLLFAALHCLVPELVSRNPSIAIGQALLFLIWPFALFTAYVMLCAPTFTPALFTTVLMVCAAAFPFWLVYLS
jgi:hypothetical protein